MTTTQKTLLALGIIVIIAIGYAIYKNATYDPYFPPVSTETPTPSVTNYPCRNDQGVAIPCQKE